MPLKISDAELCNRISERLFKYREASAEQILGEIDRLIDVSMSVEATDVLRGCAIREAAQALMDLLEEV